MSHRSNNRTRRHTGRLPPACNGIDREDDGDNVDTIPDERLRRLAHSEELKAQLCNKHLRALLQQVDAAPNKAAAVDRLMQEPLFVEFADQCLAVVTPEEEE